MEQIGLARQQPMVRPQRVVMDHDVSSTASRMRGHFPVIGKPDCPEQGGRRFVDIVDRDRELPGAARRYSVEAVTLIV